MSVSERIKPDATLTPVSLQTSTHAALLEDSPVPLWRETRTGSLVLGAVPFVIFMISWVVFSAHRPRRLLFAVPKIGDFAHWLWQDVAVSGTAWPAALQTAKEAGLGLAVGGTLAVAIGTLVGLVRVAEIVLYPVIITFKSIPAIALTPLFLLFFGFGTTAKAALVAVIVFLPIFVNTVDGMRSIRLDEIDLLRSLEASRRQIMFKVRVFRAIPSVFAGLQVAVIYSILAAVISEFLSGGSGLGALISIRTTQLNTPGIFSGLFVLAGISLLLNAVIRSTDRLVSNWKE